MVTITVPDRGYKCSKSSINAARETRNTLNNEALAQSRSRFSFQTHTQSQRSQSQNSDKGKFIPEQFVFVFLHIGRGNIWYNHLHVQLVDHRHLWGQRQRSQQSLTLEGTFILIEQMVPMNWPVLPAPQWEKEQLAVLKFTKRRNANSWSCTCHVGLNGRGTILWEV